MTISIVLMAILCLLSFLMPKSKGIAGLLLLYMWIFYGFNTYSGDYAVYEYVYNSIQSGQLVNHFEPGFSLLMVVCSMLGLSFIGFKIVLATVFVSLLYVVVNKYTTYRAFVLAVFLIFPFTYFASVLRAGISGLIVVYSLSYLAQNGRQNTVKYTLGILIAALFHSSSVFFLTFVLIKKGTDRKKILRTFGVMTVLAVLFHFNVFYRTFGLFTSNMKILQWLDTSSSVSDLSWKGKVCELIILGLYIFVMYQSKKTYHRIACKSDHYDLYKKEENMQILVYNCNVFLIILIPFLMVSDVWMRILWEITIINICMCTNTIGLIHNKKGHIAKKQSKAIISMLGLFLIATEVISLYYMNLPYRGTIDSGIEMFKNNLIFGWFNF